MADSALKTQVGIDEVGRGCWAGPLVAAAVVLDEPVAGLRDSKKLSKKRRSELNTQIMHAAKAYGVGWVFPDEIDRLGLSKSVQLAMLRAMKQLHQTYQQYSEIIIDGNINYFKNVQGLAADTVRAVIRADDSYDSVSAASIIAKVARDTYMVEQSQLYPQYGFGQHVGYGTAAHRVALHTYGVCKIHRISYAPIRKLLDQTT